MISNTKNKLSIIAVLTITYVLIGFVMARNFGYW